MSINSDNCIRNFLLQTCIELLLVLQVLLIISNKPITKWILSWTMKIKKYMDNETITYKNNSPDVLDYLWVQLRPKC